MPKRARRARGGRLFPALLLPALLFLSLAGCAEALHPVGLRRAALIEVSTADGWTLALHHFPPAPGAPPRRHPVVLCHGIMSTSYTWDLNARTSLATWLARRGFDVYALDLRGGGQSLRPGWFDAQRYDYTFDDYAELDVPAVVAAVSARAGGRPVHWVGHSMGGMVMYAWLPGDVEGRVRSFTAAGSPPSLSDHLPLMRRGMALFPLVDFFFDELPGGDLATLYSGWAHLSTITPLHILWNVENTSPEERRQLAAHATANLSARVVEQFIASAEAGRLQSMDGQRDYTAGLARITTPTLMLAGSLDHLGTPSVMADGFRRLGSADKRFVVFGRAHGARGDYGHLDLAMGRWAPTDVFPVIFDWLVRHD